MGLSVLGVSADCVVVVVVVELAIDAADSDSDSDTVYAVDCWRAGMTKNCYRDCGSGSQDCTATKDCPDDCPCDYCGD